jgi:acetolactate synthase regulatory subunit
MSKYAGLYFLVGLALWTLASAQGRKTVLQPRMALAGVIAFLVFLPNIVWNALHDWPTVGHTADNANWQGNLFNPGEALGFFLDQFGVFGPLTFAAFLALAVLSLMGRLKTIPNLSLLLSLSLPILAIGIAQAFISRAHANWAATAYVAAVLLLALSVTRLHWVRVAALISIGLHTVAMAGLYSFAVRPALADAVGLSNAFKRVRGWDEMAADIAMTARALDVDVVVAADRMITAELLYYGRSWLMPVLSWDADGVVQHHFEMTAKWTPEAGGRVLFVAREREVEEIRASFDSLTNIDSVTVSTGKNLTRTVHLFLLEGPTDKAPQRTPDGSGTR